MSSEAESAARRKRRREDRLPVLSVVIPCFNEEQAISDTIAQVRQALEAIGPAEIIVVDDGSTDGSRAVLEALAADSEALHIVHYAKNRGYGAALKMGIRRARGEWIAITDADGTYPNARLPDLFQSAGEHDMVVGARTGENVTYSRLRMVPKVFLRWYSSWLVGQDIPDINSGMRVFRRAVVERFLNILPNTFSFTTTITLAMLMNHYSVRYVPIDYAARIGRSKIHPIKDTLRFLQLILRTGVYFAPLRIFTPVVIILGIGFLISLGYDVFVLEDLTEKTLLLLLFSMNTGMFALLADMLDKRTVR